MFTRVIVTANSLECEGIPPAPPASSQNNYQWGCKLFLKGIILVPRAHDPSGLRQESRALGATISGMHHRCRLRETGWAEFGYFLCYFKMVSPRALDSCCGLEGLLPLGMRMERDGWFHSLAHVQQAIQFLCFCWKQCKPIKSKLRNLWKFSFHDNTTAGKMYSRITFTGFNLHARRYLISME